MKWLRRKTNLNQAFTQPVFSSSPPRGVTWNPFFVILFPIHSISRLQCPSVSYQFVVFATQTNKCCLCTPIVLPPGSSTLLLTSSAITTSHPSLLKQCHFLLKFTLLSLTLLCNSYVFGAPRHHHHHFNQWSSGADGWEKESYALKWVRRW